VQSQSFFNLPKAFKPVSFTPWRLVDNRFIGALLKAVENRPGPFSPV
jgi:hypothetical protein